MDIKRMIIVIPLLYLSRQFDLTEPSILLPLRILFASVMLIEACIWLYVYTKAQANTDKRIIKVKEEVSPFSNETPKESDSTISDYDVAQVKKNLTQVVMMACVIGFMHFKFEVATPLLIQLVLRPLTVFDHLLFKAYILGQDIVRPFPVPESPLSAFKDMQKKISGEDDEEKDKKKRKKSTTKKPTPEMIQKKKQLVANNKVKSE